MQGLRAAGANQVTPGRCCGECGNYAMIKRDECDFCTACRAQGVVADIVGTIANRSIQIHYFPRIKASSRVRHGMVSQHL